MTDAPQIDHGEIARQNDEFRRSYGHSRRIRGRIMMTPGIADNDAITMQRIQSEIVLLLQGLIFLSVTAGEFFVANRVEVRRIGLREPGPPVAPTTSGTVVT